MAISRGNSLLMKKQWAEDGSTVIPNPPVAGTTYRDESVDSENIAEGQQYDGVADSARWNQLLYIITGILKDTMAHGVLPWINTQDYSEGAVVMGSNGTLYIAKQANGPTAKNAKDPTTDSGESVWKAVIRLNDATMGLDSAGKILAKDIAIGGNVGDLANESGLLGTCKYVSASNTTFSIDTDIFDEAIVYSSADNPHGTFPIAATNNFWYVQQLNYQRNSNASRLQLAVLSYTSGATRAYIRAFWNTTASWTPWVEDITTNSLGDGIKNTNGILSVPEYEGATDSDPGTAGLVPPATVAERDKFLKGDGTYDIIGEDVYIKKTGDSISGPLYGGASDDVLNLCSNSPSNYGSLLSLRGPNHEQPNRFALAARKEDGTFRYLIGTGTDGRLVWDGKELVRSVNGVNADVTGNVSVSEVDSAYMLKGVVLEFHDGGTWTLPNYGSWHWIMVSNYNDGNSRSGTSSGGTVITVDIRRASCLAIRYE